MEDPRKNLEVLANETAEYYPVRNAYGLAILLGLNRTGKHIYAGTVSAEEKKRRRKANKVARQSRRTNRK